jgi:chorismate synthase
LPEIISGVFNEKTTGAPITILFKNNNTQSKDYSNLVNTPRPGHADFTAKKKYGGFNDYRGGGHFSGRLTLALVAAGVVAKKICNNIHIEAQLIEAGGNSNIEEAIDRALAEKDSIGGIIEVKAQNLPVGLGEPFFDSIESVIAHLAFSIPAIKGIEFGSGFNAAKMRGSEHNDAFVDVDGKTSQNNSGGINGGISNGNELIYRLAVKPTSSVGISQDTINMKSGEMVNLKIIGRHDACIALRVPVVAEAITAIALADLLLLNQNVKRVV